MTFFSLYFYPFLILVIEAVLEAISATKRWTSHVKARKGAHLAFRVLPLLGLADGARLKATQGKCPLALSLTFSLTWRQSQHS